MSKLIVIAIFFCTSLYSQEGFFSNIFSTEGLRLTGGFMYSTARGDDIKDLEDNYDGLDFKYQPGISFGVEKTHSSVIIYGITYTQRGFLRTYKEGSYKEEEKNYINYLTLYIVKPFPMGGIELFAGGEVATFWKAKEKTKTTYAGESDTDTDVIDRGEWEDANGNLYDYGIIAGIRFPINPQFIIQGSYYYGLSEVMDDFVASHRSFKVVVIYVIG